MNNLLSNAFKFTPENDRVTVRVAYQEKHISIKVQDTGIGISSDRLPHIFDRFYQVDNSNQRQYGGTGIGLALVKELVDVLKGQIEVSSNVGDGTTFNLTLPYSAIKNTTVPQTVFANKKTLDTDVLISADENTDFKSDSDAQKHYAHC